MNDNIAEILKNCPKGTKLYSPLFGNVTLENINSYSTDVTIEVKVHDCYYCFYKTGIYYNYESAECLLFPSSRMRDWSKFFKRGDVVHNKNNNIYAIFEGWANDDYAEFNTTINYYNIIKLFGTEEVCYTDCFVKMSDKERTVFITNAEKYYNGKYNHDTLQVEPVKLEVPLNLKSFDKVLVRNDPSQKWTVDIFSYYNREDNNFPYQCVGNCYRYCIPYTEQTAHLVGTTDNK